MDRRWKTRAAAGALAAVLASGSVFTALAADYTAAPDGKTAASDMAASMGTTEAWNDWKTEWESVKTDWTQISLTPGANASQLNFAWYTKKAADAKETGGAAKNSPATSARMEKMAARLQKKLAKTHPELAKSTAPKLIIGEGQSLRHAKIYVADQTEVADETDSQGNTYFSNKVTAKGLKENKTYFYSYDNGNGYTAPEKYRTHSDNAFSFIYVGDPQIGSSNELKGADSEAFYNAQSESVRSDAFNWAATLNAAMKKTGNRASFVVSAGDQIQTTKKKAPNKDAAKSEVEYAGYLSPDVLKSLPVATTVGNHDADNANYTYHFNTPNSSELGSNGIVGGDYYFTYGDVLFMMLNTQDTNVAEHKQFMEQAVAANKNSKWRIVTLHQDIYGSAEHSNEPEITNLRYELTPYFEEYDVDAVLTGHDHAYSRSKMLLGGAQSELAAAYTDDEFDAQLEKDMDTQGDDAQRFTAPGNIQTDTADPDEQKYLAYLNSIMDADAVEQITEKNDTVFNPQGILYMTANSSSGSKYYDLVPRMQSYIAGRWQEDVPTYSVISVTGSKLTINTYRTDNGRKIDESFSIVKNSNYREQLKKAVTQARKLAAKAKNRYTACSYKVFAKALKGAEKVLKSKKVTATKAKNALRALTEARGDLVKVKAAG